MGHVSIRLLHITRAIDGISVHDSTLQHQNNFPTAMGVFGHGCTGWNCQQAGRGIAIYRWQNAVLHFSANEPPFDLINIVANIFGQRGR